MNFLFTSSGHTGFSQQKDSAAYSAFVVLPGYLHSPVLSQGQCGHDGAISHKELVIVVVLTQYQRVMDGRTDRQTDMLTLAGTALCITSYATVL